MNNVEAGILPKMALNEPNVMNPRRILRIRLGLPGCGLECFVCSQCSSDHQWNAPEDGDRLDFILVRRQRAFAGLWIVDELVVLVGSHTEVELEEW